MPNELKTSWERLVEKCEEAGLPAPIIHPLGLGEKIAISIRHPDAAVGYDGGHDTLTGAIDKALLYVWGYRNAGRDTKRPLGQCGGPPLETAKPTTPEEMRHQAWLACSSILTGFQPYQVQLDSLARALLATNTAATLEKYHEDHKNSS